jgi:hypothetical protein
VSRSDIEDGMGFAGLVGSSPEERELERMISANNRLSKKNSELRVLLERYINTYPAFRFKHCGSPGSQVRDEQERLMELEDMARAALGARK